MKYQMGRDMGLLLPSGVLQQISRLVYLILQLVLLQVKVYLFRDHLKLLHPKGLSLGLIIRGIGYKDNNWYGIELECAYDPSITQIADIIFILKAGVLIK